MAAESYINDAGTARKVKEIYVNDGGVARKIKEIWVNDGGVARKIWSGIGAVLTGGTIEVINASPCSMRVDSDGGMYDSRGTSASIVFRYLWMLGGTSSEYECMVDNVVGTFTTDAGTGTWLNCGTDRLWTRGAATGTQEEVSFRLRIRDVATQTIQAEANFILRCDRSSA